MQFRTTPGCRLAHVLDEGWHTCFDDCERVAVDGITALGHMRRYNVGIVDRLRDLRGINRSCFERDVVLRISCRLVAVDESNYQLGTRLMLTCTRLGQVSG